VSGPSEKWRENLARGRRFTSDPNDGYTKQSQRKGGTNSSTARAAKRIFKDTLARNPTAVFSGEVLDKIREAGLEPSEKTMMELAAESTLLQWILGDPRAGKLMMELADSDGAAEQRKINRERLKIERERLELERQRVELEREKLAIQRNDPNPEDVNAQIIALADLLNNAAADINIEDIDVSPNEEEGSLPEP